MFQPKIGGKEICSDKCRRVRVREALLRRNPEQVRAKVLAWRERCRAYREIHPEYARAKGKKHSARDRERLSDAYIRALLLQDRVPFDVPPALIRAKRAQLLLWRAAK